jgi:hypothetical protein
MEQHISPRKVLVGLLGIIVFLVLASSVGVASYLLYPPEHMHPLVTLFNLNLESNVPAFFSSLQLFLASLILGLISGCHRRRDEPYRLWLLLSLLFAFLTIDEFAALHEQLSVPLREELGVSGLWYFAWIIPYGVAALALAVLFTKFLYDLPARTRAWFIGSGAIYLAGAIGFEMLGGRYITSSGPREDIYSVLYTVEELLEMLGIAFFIYALLKYMAARFQAVTWILKD